MEVKPDQTTAWSSKLARSARNLAALRAAVKDPKISKADRAIIAKALAKMQAADRYLRNLPKR